MKPIHRLLCAIRHDWRYPTAEMWERWMEGASKLGGKRWCNRPGCGTEEPLPEGWTPP